MKKSLIALAVIGFSGAAMAQSSVTLYGVADVGIGKMEGGKTEMISAGTMNNGTSRLGVRGVEDLGGGLKAGFNFEHGLSLEDGSGNKSGGQMWSRAANLWLGGNWGTFKMGRSLTPSFYGVATWELTGTANYSVVANTYNFAGAGPRDSSLFTYKTPNMGGFSAELGYITKTDNCTTPAVSVSSTGVVTGSPRVCSGSKWDLNAIYANGPIGIGLSANKTQHQKTNWSLGGKYNFGNFAVAASYHDAKDMGRRGFGLGGTATFGAASVTLDLTRDTRNGGGKKYTNGLLEAKYALSKRTFMYGAYLRLDGTNNYGIGVRHNF